VRYVAARASRPASTGAVTAGRTTLTRTLSKLTAAVPPTTKLAPINPPNNAWDELDGRPSSQVSRF
jgi:hypothetical protein